MNDAIRMQLSAFVDGELPENESELLLRRMSQDVELRQEVAEYLALSRIIRGELGVAATDRLHERVVAEMAVAELDEPPAAEADRDDGAVATRSIKPLAGFAVAATVALVAIFGLQRGDNEVDVSSAEPAALAVVPEVDSREEQQRQYLLHHADASSQFGSNSINSRLVSLRFSEDVDEDVDEEVSDESRVDEITDVLQDALEEAPAQP